MTRTNPNAGVATDLEWVRDFSVWPIRSELFRSDRFDQAVSVSRHFSRFGFETFRSDYAILQKSYMFTF